MDITDVDLDRFDLHVKRAFRQLIWLQKLDLLVAIDTKLPKLRKAVLDEITTLTAIASGVIPQPMTDRP